MMIKRSFWFAVKWDKVSAAEMRIRGDWTFRRRGGASRPAFLVRICLAGSRENEHLRSRARTRSYVPTPRGTYIRSTLSWVPPSRGLPSSYLPFLYVTANSVFSRRCLSFLFLSPSPLSRRVSSSLSSTISIRFALFAIPRPLPLLAARPGQATHFSFLRNRKQQSTSKAYPKIFYGFVNTGVRTFLLVLVSFKQPHYLPPSCRKVPRPARQIRKNVHANLILPLTLTLGLFPTLDQVKLVSNPSLMVYTVSVISTRDRATSHNFARYPTVTNAHTYIRTYIWHKGRPFQRN